MAVRFRAGTFKRRFATMSAPLAATNRRPKPTVVIAGWLGCQPSKLRRYQEFYKQRGYPTLIRIATPWMVVTSVTPSPLIEPPLHWPHTRYGAESTSTKLTSMQDLAWEVLQQLHQDNSPNFLIHSFSNGGCFVYEQLRRILQPQHTPPLDPNISYVLQQFRMVGAVFDSCPALDLTKLDQALSYCTDEERSELERKHPNFRQEVEPYLHRRQDEYRNFLTYEDAPVSQLYIYSRNDPLVPYDQLDLLVNERLRQLKTDARDSVAAANESTSIVVRILVLDQSRHCAHFLTNPVLYSEVLESFLHECVDGVDQLQSKL